MPTFDFDAELPPLDYPFLWEATNVKEYTSKKESGAKGLFVTWEIQDEGEHAGKTIDLYMCWDERWPGLVQRDLEVMGFEVAGKVELDHHEILGKLVYGPIARGKGDRVGWKYKQCRPGTKEDVMSAVGQSSGDSDVPF